jgi:hypothetical protein
MIYENVIRSAALLRGDPNFETFLDLVRDARDEMESEMENFENIGNHAVMAFLAGQISLCKKLLDIGRPIDEER